jgi:hypothetical protein
VTDATFGQKIHNFDSFLHNEPKLMVLLDCAIFPPMAFSHSQNMFFPSGNNVLANRAWSNPSPFVLRVSLVSTTVKITRFNGLFVQTAQSQSHPCKLCFSSEKRTSKRGLERSKPSLIWFLDAGVSSLKQTPTVRRISWAPIALHELDLNASYRVV